MLPRTKKTKTCHNVSSCGSLLFCALLSYSKRGISIFFLNKVIIIMCLAFSRRGGTLMWHACFGQICLLITALLFFFFEEGGAWMMGTFFFVAFFFCCNDAYGQRWYKYSQLWQGKGSISSVVLQAKGYTEKHQQLTGAEEIDFLNPPLQICCR